MSKRKSVFCGVSYVALFVFVYAAFQPVQTTAQEASPSSETCQSPAQIETFAYSTLCFHPAAIPKKFKSWDRSRIEAWRNNWHDIVRSLLMIRGVALQVVQGEKSRKDAKKDIKRLIDDVCRKSDYPCELSTNVYSSESHREAASFMQIANMSDAILGKIQENGNQLSPAGLVLFARQMTARLNALCDNRSCTDSK